jgi:hypothetical protein
MPRTSRTGGIRFGLEGLCAQWEMFLSERNLLVRALLEHSSALRVISLSDRRQDSLLARRGVVLLHHFPATSQFYRAPYLYCFIRLCRAKSLHSLPCRGATPPTTVEPAAYVGQVSVRVYTALPTDIADTISTINEIQKPSTSTGTIACASKTSGRGKAFPFGPRF